MTIQQSLATLTATPFVFFGLAILLTPARAADLLNRLADRIHPDYDS